MGLFPNITIAVVLLVIAVVTVVISQMGILPKQSLPYIAAGLAGVFGIAVFRKWRETALRGELEQREQELQGLASRAQQSRAGVTAADQQLTTALATLQSQREAAQKQLLLIHASTAQEQEAISNLHGEELFQKYDEAFGAPTQ
jgi:Skp family chaperone for outer membrane proteins